VKKLGLLVSLLKTSGGLVINLKIKIRSIFSKIFGGYLLIIFMLSGLILYYTYDTLKTDYLNYLSNYLKQVNYTIGLSITPLLGKADIAGLDSSIKNIGNKINTRITVISADGKVIADSKIDAESMENHLSRPEIRQAIINGNGSAIRLSKTFREEMLYDAQSIYINGKIVAFCRVSIFLKDIGSLVDILINKILKITLIIVSLSLILIIIFSRSFTRPLKYLAIAARSVAEGNFNIKVKLTNKDEFRDVADSFNYMTDHIKSLFDQISMQKEELDLIINSVQEGFLVLNLEGRVILYNKGFGNIINSSELKGKYYKELVENKDFNKLIKKTIKKKKSSTDEIELGENFYLCSSNYLEAKKEIVMILYNITELKKLEKIKKDFVSNVSHELRTPLTAIKGFIETMEDEINSIEKVNFGETNAKEKFTRYINIISRHTNRLINIVRDLLMLSNLEDTMTVLELSEINIYDLVANVTRIFEQKIAEKKLNLNCNISKNIPLFTADAFKLEQLLINLIDNAIKYTDEGSISINLSCDKYSLFIDVTDTGIGIPHNDLDRIFERFYTVDKSRSRRLGGTGLGLSIVKHIVLLHNGEVNVNSHTGKGTTFNIILPLTINI
jgi:two-component system phosphate regulon sensor histidine kinase PhoR